jgi:hypothetical protein
MMALQLFVVLKLYPETRGMSLESIETTLHLEPETI